MSLRKGSRQFLLDPDHRPSATILSAMANVLQPNIDFPRRAVAHAPSALGFGFGLGLGVERRDTECSTWKKKMTNVRETSRRRREGERSPSESQQQIRTPAGGNLAQSVPSCK